MVIGESYDTFLDAKLDLQEVLAQILLKSCELWEFF
jgi:hypothetical protein